jgi:hypothetical protein
LLNLMVPRIPRTTIFMEHLEMLGWRLSRPRLTQ